MGEDTLKKLVKEHSGHVRDLRRKIHAHPELSYEETATAALAAAELRACGFDVQEHVGGGNGVVGVLQGAGPGRTVALRADMDALSVQEETGLPFASAVDGKMHACGHDAHTAMLLGAAHVLADMRDSFQGTVKIICQPAEEKSPDGGAKAIVHSGVLGHVDAIYGLHVWPQLPTGMVGVKTGPIMAASTHVTVTIRGVSSHAAMPHKGIDAIVAAGQFLTAAQSILSRQINPLYPAVLTFGTIHGGSRYNVVADEVILDGTCRTYQKEAEDAIEEKLLALLAGIDAMYGTQSSLDFVRGYGSVTNSPAQAAFAASVVTDRFGEAALANIEEPAMTGEDFYAYLQAYDGAFVWLGTAKPGEEAYPLHNSHFTIDEDMLPVGVELLSALALATLS